RGNAAPVIACLHPRRRDRHGRSAYCRLSQRHRGGPLRLRERYRDRLAYIGLAGVRKIDREARARLFRQKRYRAAPAFARRFSYLVNVSPGAEPQIPEEITDLRRLCPEPRMPCRERARKTNVYHWPAPLPARPARASMPP